MCCWQECTAGSTAASTSASKTCPVKGTVADLQNKARIDLNKAQGYANAAAAALAKGDVKNAQRIAEAAGKALQEDEADEQEIRDLLKKTQPAKSDTQQGNPPGDLGSAAGVTIKAILSLIPK